MSYERKLAPDQPAANDPKYVVIEQRARIAALEAELADITRDCSGWKADALTHAKNSLANKQRAEQAEARVTALDIQLRDADHENIGLKAEVERLRNRQCSTCSNWNHGHGDDGDVVNYCRRLDHAIPRDFGCNRWTAREEAGE